MEASRSNTIFLCTSRFKVHVFETQGLTLKRPRGLGSPWQFMTSSNQIEFGTTHKMQAMRKVGPRCSEAPNNLDSIPSWSNQGNNYDCRIHLIFKPPWSRIGGLSKPPPTKVARVRVVGMGNTEKARASVPRPWLILTLAYPDHAPP